MNNIQRIYDTPTLTNNIFKYRSTEIHRKNLIDIKRRKANKLYKVNEDYLEMKRKNQSPSRKNNCRK
jgi:hypothetical protein